MSGVYIKMPMPENCGECPFNYDCFSCIKTGTRFFAKEGFDHFKDRLSDCPLFAVLDHGDLIDRQELEAKMKTRSWYVGRASDPDCLVADAPTVIPADKEKT